VRGVLTLLSCVPYYGRITVFGDKGWIEVVTEGNVDQGKPTIVTVCKGTNAPREVTTFQPTDTVTENFEAWAAAVAGEKPYRFTPAQLLDNVKIFESIATSARDGGKTIRL
jgi:predicted dehydrogenase